VEIAGNRQRCRAQTAEGRNGKSRQTEFKSGLLILFSFLTLLPKKRKRQSKKIILDRLDFCQE
jgi:hypothetical protein